jgi:hypothetical protein
MTKIKTTTKTKSTFTNLYQINVNEHTEKKAGLTYLTWSWAWAKVKEIHPTASYTYYKHPETNLPFSFQENVGAFCHTSVTINDETLEMWLPVMGNRNEAILEPTSTQINKTLMRCLVKNIAMFGLGLYIYEGEDLPEITEDVIKESNETKADKIDYDKLNKKDKQEIVTGGKKLVLAGSSWRTIETRILTAYKIEKLDLDNIKEEVYAK